MPGHKKIRSKTKKIKLNRGLSWLSILLVIIGLSILMGGFVFLPKFSRDNTTDNTQSIVQPDPDCSKGDNLHLCTFNLITVTPSPMPPSPTTNPKPPAYQPPVTNIPDNDTITDKPGGNASPKPPPPTKKPAPTIGITNTPKAPPL